MAIAFSEGDRRSEYYFTRGTTKFCLVLVPNHGFGCLMSTALCPRSSYAVSQLLRRDDRAARVLCTCTFECGVNFLASFDDTTSCAGHRSELSADRSSTPSLLVNTYAPYLRHSVVAVVIVVVF